MNDVTELVQAITNERERCAMLAETLAMKYEHFAGEFIKDGTRTSRSVWPPFKKKTYIATHEERAAKALDEAAHGMRIIAQGCRAGWDPRPMPFQEVCYPNPDRPGWCLDCYDGPCNQ